MRPLYAEERLAAAYSAINYGAPYFKNALSPKVGREFHRFAHLLLCVLGGDRSAANKLRKRGQRRRKATKVTP